jgi:hypothetical protein
MVNQVARDTLHGAIRRRRVLHAVTQHTVAQKELSTRALSVTDDIHARSRAFISRPALSRDWFALARRQ